MAVDPGDPQTRGLRARDVVHITFADVQDFMGLKAELFERFLEHKPMRRARLRMSLRGRWLRRRQMEGLGMAPDEEVRGGIAAG